MGVKLAAALGGSVELVPTNTASNYTVTLPASTSTVLTTTTSGIAISGPAFRAKPTTTQTLTSAVPTKVVLNSEIFDTANCFDSTTNYRFTPNVAGYYQFSASVYTAGSTMAYNFISFYKNGVRDSSAIYGPYSGTDNIGSVSALIYLNGSTDYVELYDSTSGSGTINLYADYTFFSGFLARAA